MSVLGLPIARWRVYAAPLLAHVVMVVSGCAKKQVIGIYAGRIITRVANKHSFGNFTFVPFVAKSMGVHGLVAKSDFAITSARLARYPDPTGISLGDIGPKAFFEGWVNISKVILNIANRFALDLASLVSIARCNGCELTASTMAISIRDILFSHFDLSFRHTSSIPLLGTWTK